MEANCNYKVTIKGVVQGIGMRPFLYRLASSYNFRGRVYNHNSGVSIEIEGNDLNQIQSFMQDLQENSPVHSKIYHIELEKIPFLEYKDFSMDYYSGGSKTLSLSPDLSFCEACRKETLDPKSRRSQYPFTTCAECGPRYSIMRSIPYERENTSMNEFPLCESCKREFTDINDRRFHAVTISCKECGPTLSYYSNQSKEYFYKDSRNYSEIITGLANDIWKGKIIAIQSIGGFHFICLANSDIVIRNLREKKKRNSKPFAIMFKDICMLEEYAEISAFDRALLQSPMAPIVLLKAKKKSKLLSSYVNRNSPYIGAILPSAPLHLLIMEKVNTPIIFTSANVANEGILYRVDEALTNSISDTVLFHNREIMFSCEDSVILPFREKSFFIRKSRGYVPALHSVSNKRSSEYFCTGADLNNSISVLSQEFLLEGMYNGNVQNPQIYKDYLRQTEFLSSFLNTEYTLVHDLHPSYNTSEWASEKNHQKLGVQHHHAHIAACLGEHSSFETVIGIALDGTGYGYEGEIAGFEFLIANRKEARNVFHLSELPLVGGEAAIHEPWRIAVACLQACSYTIEDILSLPFSKQIKEEGIRMLYSLAESSIRTVYTSGCGRLFDAVSALCSVCTVSEYDAHAAIDFENCIYGNLDNENVALDFETEPFYTFTVNKENRLIDWKPLLIKIVEDIKKNVPVQKISRNFHLALIKAIVEVVEFLSVETGIRTIALGGGVFMNRFILSNLVDDLEAKNYKVLYPSNIPVNDSGIAFGQAIIALEREQETVCV
ncbi:MAG: carbamoyltransferase HypF [Leptospiraceae bacterium]|nr:carbamoyltransferase HypF [Leptospiraceae bacterium]MCP5500305.1 carbamoyltransferase HypF [Leptospiraceae bacterium]